MEINLKKLGQQAIETTTDNATKMRLSEDASSMVFQLFTKNVYSNPIGTVIREITSNCFDSHVEAQTNDPNWKKAPVVIRKHKDENSGTQYISFIDYGVGMSPDRVQNVYGVYFESTKRIDNTQIGGFGIGGKTPLAYKRSTGAGEGEYDNSFYVITVFNGTKYFYIISEGEECPVIHKLHEEATEDRNGTEIQIPVLQKDMEKFETEMRRQLYYFENVVFDGFPKTDYNGNVVTDDQGNPVSLMENNYQIVRGKTFLFRGEAYSNYMHVCLGRVAYPIDYSTLDLQQGDYRLPIALKLEVGDINVTVSREQLDYSEKTIKLLRAKLDEAKQEIADLIGKQYQSIQTLEQYFSVKNDFGKLQFPNGTSLYVGDLIKQKDVDFSNFKYQFMKMPNDKQLFRFFFEAKQMGKKPRTSRYSSNDDTFTGGYESLKDKTNICYVDDQWKRKVVKQAWLKEKYGTWYLVQKRRVEDKYMIHEIADLFNVALDNTVDDNGKPVQFVQSLLEMQDEYWSIVQREAKNYDSIEIPEDFIESRKRGAGITPELRKITIPVNFIGGNSRERIKLDNLFKYRMPIVYGTTDDEYALSNAKTMFDILFHEDAYVTHEGYNGEFRTRAQRSHGYYNSNKKEDEPMQSIMFIRVAKNNVKYMEFCRNAYHVSEFNNRMLRRKTDVVRQYFLTAELVDKFKELDGFYRRGFIDVISDKWGKKIDDIKKYIENIPKEAKNDNIRYHKHTLKQYFDVDNLKPDAEQKKVMKTIEEVQALQDKNNNLMRYFNIPYSAEDLEKEQELVTILQVSLAL
jgi:hypothetical protein